LSPLVSWVHIRIINEFSISVCAISQEHLLKVPKYRSLFPATLPILACHRPCWWCLSDINNPTVTRIIWRMPLQMLLQCYWSIVQTANYVQTPALSFCRLTSHCHEWWKILPTVWLLCRWRHLARSRCSSWQNGRSTRREGQVNMWAELQIKGKQHGAGRAGHMRLCEHARVRQRGVCTWKRTRRRALCRACGWLALGGERCSPAERRDELLPRHRLHLLQLLLVVWHLPWIIQVSVCTLRQQSPACDVYAPCMRLDSGVAMGWYDVETELMSYREVRRRGRTPVLERREVVSSRRLLLLIITSYIFPHFHN
jgi:hypothetical protein